MQIGVDIHMCRLTETGLFTYLWNLLHGLSLDHPHELKLFLYGNHELEEPEQVRRLVASLPRGEVRYVWDAQRLLLLARGSNGAGGKLAQRIDRRVLLAVWREMLFPNSRASYYVSALSWRQTITLVRRLI